MARKNQNKPIVETDKPGGKVVMYWPSSKSAADHYKINQVNISYNINGITKQAKGHYFRYATPKETAAYEESIKRIDTAEAVPQEPAAPEVITPIIPVDIIPETVNKTELPPDSLTPFERMLQKSKEKFKENSD